MYIVAHLWGGLLKSVTPYQSLALAQKGMDQAIPEPCDCDDECESYQEAYLLEVPIGLPGPEVGLESRHSPSKS